MSIPAILIQSESAELADRVRAAIEIEAAGCHAEVHQACRCLAHSPTDATHLTVLDLADLDERRLVAKVVSQLSAHPAPIVALVAPAQVSRAVAAMRSGCFAVCETHQVEQQLGALVRDALTHETERRAAVARRDAIAQRLATLTAKEHDVLDLVLAGLANKNIAKRLGCSLKTIEVRRQSVMRKMQVENVADLVRHVLIALPDWQLPERLATPTAGRRLDAGHATPAPIAPIASSPLVWQTLGSMHHP